MRRRTPGVDSIVERVWFFFIIIFTVYRRTQRTRKVYFVQPHVVIPVLEREKLNASPTPAVVWAIKKKKKKKTAKKNVLFRSSPTLFRLPPPSP